VFTNDLVKHSKPKSILCHFCVKRCTVCTRTSRRKCFRFDKAKIILVNILGSHVDVSEYEIQEIKYLRERDHLLSEPD